MGQIKIIGNRAGVNYYQMQGKYYARRKSEALTRERIRCDPAFRRTREMNAEFREATRWAKRISDLFRPILIRDRYYFSRLTKRSMEILRTDQESPRGERKVAKGKVEHYQGFELVEANPVAALGIKPFINWDQEARQVKARIPAFIPARDIRAPRRARHVQLSLGVGQMGLESEKMVSDFQELGLVDLKNHQMVEEQVFRFDLVDLGQPVLVLGCMRVRFFEGEVRGDVPTCSKGNGAVLWMLLSEYHQR